MRPGPSAPLFPGRPPSRPFLRTARLDTVGYAALAGACLLAAAVAGPVLRATGWPPAVRTAGGPVAVLVALVAADRRRWSRRETSFSFTDDPAELHAVADRLVGRGLPVRVAERPGGPRLTYRNGDAGRVQAALREMGIRTD